MNKGNNILEPIGKGTWKVPEGYFDSLKDRLYTIPEMESERRRISWFTKMRPYFALAAAFAAILVAGTLILRSTIHSEASEDDIYYNLMVADLIPVTMEYSSLDDGLSQENVPEEEIIEYLINSGVSERMLAMEEMQNK